MRDQLVQTGYEIDAEARVWLRRGYGGIAYSDGDEVEQRRISACSPRNCVSTALIGHRSIT
jgi:hypothetical protein